MKVYISQDEQWPVYLTEPEAEASDYVKRSPQHHVPAELTDEESELIAAGWRAWNAMQDMLREKWQSAHDTPTTQGD